MALAVAALRGHREVVIHRCTAVALLALLMTSCQNFHEVEKGRLYRSAQPDAEQLTRWIWRYDIETVLRLNGSGPGDPDYEASMQPARAAGVDFVHVPMSAVRFLDKERMVQLVDALENARYPLLMHCRAGADRTGLASAVYQLIHYDDLEKARGQLATIPYLHFGIWGLDKPDLTLDMYEPWHGVLTFGEWARQIYERPENDELPADYIEKQRERVAEYVARSATR